MKRLASESVEGPDPDLSKRIRIGDVAGEGMEDQLQPADDFSDSESRHTETTSGLPIDTPLTPLSPARKWPSDMKTIRCTFPNCPKTFNRPARLAAHLRSHKNERPFKCTFPGCDKDYIEEKHLKQHVKGSHTSERNHVCAVEGCGKQFMTATRLRRHQLVHEGQERFKCRDYPPCTQSFRKHQTLQRHIRTEHQHQFAYPCNHKDNDSGALCPFGYDTAGGLRRHQERDHGENRFWCDECAAQQDSEGNPKRVGFPTLLLLQAHMKQSHVNCMFCGKSCGGWDDLERHVESEHAHRKTGEEERKVFACTWPGCTKSFTRKSNLTTHIRSAHEGVSFVCGEFDLSQTKDLAGWTNAQGCGQAFSLKLALENHVRYVHLKHERPEAGVSASQLSLLQNQSDRTVLEQLSGVGEKTRRTVPCTFSDCHLKFTYFGELETHIREAHAEHMARTDHGPAPVEAAPPPIGGYRDVKQEMKEWEKDFAGPEFWVGADMSANTFQANADEEWLRDEAEMRRLIGIEDFDDLIDPLLRPRA
ncbi:hypothetical protein F5Y17DRAFT_464924 [Xylariaceae sp. FL0594]|nr:hypothetical protein F5Y17DRAFT_464924 [Xylariaceae sp. FL0594]